ncbi:MAG: hypothetical protein ABL940_05965 [Bacteroidia bacterium]
MKYIALSLLLASTGAQAQLTQRYANDSSKVAFGTRPTKGDKSLMLNVVLFDSTSQINHIADVIKLSERLTFRYYLKPNLVFRASAKVQRKAVVASGNSADSSFVNILTTSQKITALTRKNSNTVLLVPGIEKHFSPKNIFDVYYGAALPIGYTSTKIKNEITRQNGDYDRQQVKQFSPIVGLDAFTGLNVFVGKLPLSLGLEYGWGALWKLNNKVNVSQQQQITSGTKVQSFTAEYSTQNQDALGTTDINKYGKLNKREFAAGLNQTIKLTCNIYFR